MVKFVLLFILACTAYVCAYPSQKNGFTPEESLESHVPPAAYPDNYENHADYRLIEDIRSFVEPEICTKLEVTAPANRDNYNKKYDNGHDVHNYDHSRQPEGYDEIYVYVDVPETDSNNSQASVIEAALVQVEDDADLRRVISDIISSELQDQKTPKYSYPRVVVDNKSPADPDSTLSPEFIRRK